MSERARKRRDFIQNITIAILFVSAALLFFWSQIHNLGAGTDYLQFLSSPDSAAGVDSIGQGNTALTVPVRVAVTGPFGRYGSITLTTAGEEFAPLQGLLEQALGSAQAYAAVDRRTFLNALTSTCVYYDFLSPLPLSVLAELTQTAAGGGDVSARYLAVAAESDGVALYLWDGDGACLRCNTALPPEDLEDTVGQYELGGAFFAFEDAQPYAREAAPCSLFLEEEPILPALTVSAPLSDTDRLLSALDFNPNTQNRYPGSGGEEVIVENERTLRIHTDGTITYTSGGSATLSIQAAEERPTMPEAATETGALLGQLLSPFLGEAAGLYLEKVQQTGTTTTLHFGYHMHGVPVRFSDGQAAARVTLSGTAVSSLSLRIRQYAGDGSVSTLLPLRQALAIAARHPGGELFIGYVDSGIGSASAKWLSE